MEAGLEKGNQKLYLSIFSSLILSIVLTILIVSTIQYINFQSIALDQVYSDNMKNLMQTRESVKLMAGTAMTLSNQIYNDQSVARLLYYSNPEIFDVRSASDQLTNYRLSLSFIDSVYVYNGKNGTIYINAASNRNTTRETIQDKKAFDDSECIDILDHFISYKQYVPIPRKYVANKEEGIVKYYYTFCMYDAFVGSVLDSAVIVNFTEDWIQNVINVESGDNAGETFIIDNKGNLVSNSVKYPMLENISDRNFIKKIIAHSNAQGYFIDTVDGFKSLITYTEADEIGWRYIRVTPWNVLFNRIESMKAMTVYIGLAILVFGLLAAFLVTKRLYVPIGKIISNLKSLETERQSNFELIRKGFLKDIILGRENEDKAGILERFRSLDIRLGLSGSFRLVLLKIDFYNDFYQKYNPEERSIFRNAIINIYTEIFSKYFKAEVVDMGEGNIVILLNYDGPQRIVAEGAFEVFAGARDAVAKRLGISLTTTISGEENSLEDINALYRQALEASLHRLFYGHASIISAEKIEELDKKEYKFPMQKEKQLVDALMSQKGDEARRIYDEIIRDAADYPFSVINLAISHLIFTINNALNTIKNNNSLLSDFSAPLPAMIINNAETMDEVNGVFYNLFEELNKYFDERKSMKHEEIVNSINDIILRNFSDPNLSIEGIADNLGITPTYMCKLYKQNTMTTILDKIVEVRMEKAKELLLKKGNPVADIAQDTGYTNSSYFYRAFRKYYGTTPNDFRRVNGSAR